MARKKAAQNDAQALPGPVSPEAINEELGIMRYVEKEIPEETALFVEKVKTEQVFDTRMDIWNVHTKKNRYWVITNPAGCYSQAQFPSFDYALTFHVGLAYRNASSHRAEEAEKEQDQFAVPWRHWEQAAAALDRASAAEEFQAVGILCRECLVSLVKAIVRDEMVLPGQDRPQMADFLPWSEWIADSFAPGPSEEAVRSYLKTISKAAWQLVNWLAQATNATRPDGNMAVEATEYVLLAYAGALTRRQPGAAG